MMPLDEAPEGMPTMDDWRFHKSGNIGNGGNMIYDVLDDRLPISLYDIPGISLTVEVKRSSSPRSDEDRQTNKKGDEEKSDASSMMRLHACFTGTVSFSMRGAPTYTERFGHSSPLIL